MKRRFQQLAYYAFSKAQMERRAFRFAKISSILNAFLALAKIALGIYSASFFICFSGIYNIGIAFAKHLIVQSCDLTKHHKNYKRIGHIIITTSVAYMVYCANMAIRGKANVSYDLITSLAIATFSFAEIGIAAYGIGSVRKSMNLNLMAAKRVNLVSALISIVLTESALLGLDGVPNAANYCGFTGLLFGAVSAFIGLHMSVSRGMQRLTRNNRISRDKH